MSEAPSRLDLLLTGLEIASVRKRIQLLCKVNAEGVYTEGRWYKQRKGNLSLGEKGVNKKVRSDALADEELVRWRMGPKELYLPHSRHVTRLRRRARSDRHGCSEGRLPGPSTDSDRFRVAGSDPDDDRLVAANDENFDPVVDVQRFGLGGLLEAPDERLLDDGPTVGGDDPAQVPTCEGVVTNLRSSRESTQLTFRDEEEPWRTVGSLSRAAEERDGR